MKSILVLFLLSAFFVACAHWPSTPTYYVINNPNIPLLKQKNNLLISASLRISGTSGNENYLTQHGCIAYAVTNHLGIIASGSVADNEDYKIAVEPWESPFSPLSR